MSGANSVDFDLIPEQPIATEIAGLWTTWDGARAEWRARVEENKKYVYATSTRETTNVVNPHSHTTHIPKISQIYDNLLANYFSALFPHEDWLKFFGNDPIAEEFDKKRAVLAYINTKHRLNNFQNIMLQLLGDWILTGNAFAGVTYVQEHHVNPVTGELMVGYVGPKVYRISPDDIVFNPLATDFRSAPKIIRSIKTLGELHRDAEEYPALGYSTEVIDIITKNREVLKNFTDTSVNKHIQMQYDGFGTASVYYKSGYVEILEFYGDIYDTNEGVWYKNHVITVVDRMYVVRNEPLNTWSGRPYIYHCGWRPRPDNLWAMGPLDNLVGMQYLIDHLENARADAFDQMIDPDRVIKGDVDIEQRGGAIDYYVNDPSIGGDVRYLAPDTTVMNADFQIQRKEAQMEEYAGAPREAMGIRTPGEKTAFEVSSLQNAAGRIFQNKITYFESEFMEPLINGEVEVSRINLDGTDIVRILDDDYGVTEFLRITQADLMSNGTLIPMGARHFARQATLVQNLMQFSQAMMGDPMLMQHFPAENLARAWEDLLGFKRLELFRKYGRIEEEMELARLQSAAQNQLQTEQQMTDQMAMEGQPTV
jgi:hypothetical protein